MITRDRKLRDLPGRVFDHNDYLCSLWGGSMLMAGGGSGYRVRYSALFDGSTGYLSKTFASAGNQQAWTFNGKFAPCAVSGDMALFSADIGLSVWTLYYRSGGQLRFLCATSGSDETTAYYRDLTGAEIDLTVSWDGANLVWEVNGDTITDFGLTTTASGNSSINNTSSHNIGRKTDTANGFYNGYMSEIRFIDGQVLSASDFGELDLASGNWVPKSYSGTYGTNGFYLDFSNGANLGEDRSGNGNHWTVNGTVTQSTDTPTNNHAAWNALEPSANDYANGNKKVTLNTSGESVRSTLNFSSGKWYAEFVCTAGGDGHTGIGISLADADLDSVTSTGTVNAGTFVFADDGRTIENGVTQVSGLTNITTGARVMIAVDHDAEKIWWGVNGTWEGSGNPSAGTGEQDSLSGYAGRPFAFFAFAMATTTNAWEAAFAADEWSYTPPTDFKALCTDNLPDVAAKNVSEHFAAVPYTGNNTGQSISGVGFQPDFVWIKSRANVYDHALYDAIRGATKGLSTNTTGGERTDDSLTSFDSDGFTVGTWGAVNNIGTPYVAWCAKLPNVKTSGWAGSPTITPIKEIYNPDLGMSIITYVGSDSVTDTIPHSLGKKPKMAIIKRLDGGVYSWCVWVDGVTDTDYKELNLHNTNAVTVRGETRWSAANTSSTLFGIGTNNNINGSGGTFVIYLFAETDFLKIGSYAANASSDGVFINEMIAPVFGLFKKSSGTSNWLAFDDLRDGNNPDNDALFPDGSGVEDSSDRIDLVSTGVKCRANLDPNTSGTWLHLLIGQPTGAGNTTPAPAR